MLDLSKAEAGKLELARAPVDLRRELEQVVGLFSGRACDKGIEIAAHIARDVPAIIQGDPIRLRQVLSNLVNNAVKFTESGAVLLAVNAGPERNGAVRCSSSRSPTPASAWPPDEQQRIFDAFEQADGSVTRKFGGTGLGLAICRQLVELMHGNMGAGERQGGGSRFSFAIPAGVARSERRPQSRPPADVGALVIGVHPVIRSAACDTIIGTQSAHVISVDSADGRHRSAAGLSTPQVSRVRVFIDACAVRNLEQAASGLRAAASPRHVEVIALHAARRRCRRLLAGVNRCLVKPLCTADLIASRRRRSTRRSARACAPCP